jgi:aromatic-L-amino-acid decarboxylase
MGLAAVEFIVELHHRHHGIAGPAQHSRRPGTDRLVRRHPGVPAQPTEFTVALQEFAAAGADRVDTLNPYDFAHVPSGGLYTAAVADFLSRGMNPFTGMGSQAPSLVALEDNVIHWLCTMLGLPATAGGVSTTGASLATLTALVAARHDRLDDNHLNRGVLYLTEQTHHSLAKAARIAGLPSNHVRIVPTAPDLTMDVAATEAMIQHDLAAGLRPFLLVATAGATNTGTVDPLGEAARLAAHYDLWFHVDGAYGGWFAVTDRGRTWLAGIERADSIVLDAHKGLSLPYGTATLLVRDPSTLRAAFAATGTYLPDPEPGVPDFAMHGLELTREYRGLHLWLPLHVHGLDTFRDMLDNRLDLAAEAHADLTADPLLQLPWTPGLSTVVFGLSHGDYQTLLCRIHTTSAVRLSSTRVRDRDLIRMCVLSHRTHRKHVHEALAMIHAAARCLDG